MAKYRCGKMIVMCLVVLATLLYWLVCSFLYIPSLEILPLPQLSHIYMVDGAKWIVVTTISPPTADIKFLARIPGWRVVVVGDQNTSDAWHHENCTFLSLKDQNALPFSIVKLIKPGLYARKTIGYLYAISKGAEVIYETDDDNRPIDLLQNFNLNPVMYGLRFVGQNLFNPYRHFGQPSLWPRGYPLDEIGAKENLTYNVALFKTPYIQQGLVNGDPDMDAIFRLTRKASSSVLNVTFDSVAPPVIIPSGVISPFNKQNTLYVYEAFWAMVLPTTTSSRVSGIWRGYWAQRLLWEIDGSLGFFPPNVFQKRNSHSYIQDAKEEQSLYFKATDLVKFLRAWRCDKQLAFFQCAESLSMEMVKREYWKLEDSTLIKTWLKDLRIIGYIEPKRTPYYQPEVLKSNNLTTVLYQPTEQKFPRIHKSKHILQSKWDQVLGITSFCSNTSYQITRNSLSSITYPNILLIIVFNFPIYDNIPFLQLMYGVTFTHIVYCGNNMQSFVNASRNFSEHVTFLEADVNRGYYVYRCMTEAMKMQYTVTGYLMIGDDTLLNPWNIPALSLDKLWYHHPEIVYRDKKNYWHWWNGPMGSVVFNKLWDELQRTANTTDDVNQFMIRNFTHMLETNTGSNLGTYRGPSDIVFIPQGYKDKAVFFMDLMSTYNVFLEVAVPSVVFGLENINNTVKLVGQYLWYDGKRERVPQIFNSTQIFLHPVKLTSIKTSLKSFFCKTFFPLTLGINQNK